MAVRAKFKCVSIEASAEPDCKNIRLEAVISGSPENEEFFRYTPTGMLSLGLVTPATQAQFELGQEYYIDITQAPMPDDIPY